MIHLRLGLVLLMALNSCLQHTPVYSAEQSGAAGVDTVRLGVTAGTYELNEQTRAIHMHIALQKQAGRNLTHYYLRLKGALLTEAPDGVYEVYVGNRQFSAPEDLSSDNPGFADVLNLFALTGGSRQDVDVDISTAMRNIFQSSAPAAVYLAIRFRGNTDKDKRESLHAGHFSITGAGITGVK